MSFIPCQKGEDTKNGERCLSDNIVAILESFTFEHLHKIIIAVENRGCFTFFMEHRKISPIGSYQSPDCILYLHYVICIILPFPLKTRILIIVTMDRLILFILSSNINNIKISFYSQNYITRFAILLGTRENENREGERERQRGSTTIRTPRFYSAPFGVTTSVETSFSAGLQIPGRNMRTIMGFQIINLLYRVYYLSSVQTGEPPASCY